MLNHFAHAGHDHSEAAAAETTIQSAKESTLGATQQTTTGAQGGEVSLAPYIGGATAILAGALMIAIVFYTARKTAKVIDGEQQ